MLGPGHKQTIKEVGMRLRELGLIYHFPHSIRAAALSLSIEWRLDYEVVYRALIESAGIEELEADFEARMKNIKL